MAPAALVVAVLALCVSAWNTWNQRKAGLRAQRDRLDADAPKLRVIGPEPRFERYGERRSPAIDPTLYPAPPGTEYVLPRQAAEKIIVGADLLLVNEGATSVVVAIDGGAMFNEGVGTFATWFPPGQNAKLPHAQVDGSYVVAPAAKCLLLVRDGLTVAEWAADTDQPVRVELRAAVLGGNGVEDRWVVEMRGRVLDAVPQDASHWRVADHTPIDARLHQLARRYPASP